MRAWLYCRVANGWDADARDYLALQKAELERFCKEHDLTVAGNTMVTGNGRDELRELVHSAVEQDTFDILVAVSISEHVLHTDTNYQTVNLKSFQRKQRLLKTFSNCICLARV